MNKNKIKITIEIDAEEEGIQTIEFDHRRSIKNVVSRLREIDINKGIDEVLNEQINNDFSRKGIKKSYAKPGNKVHYVPFIGANDSMIENGIIKSNNEGMDGHCFVVFNCANDWDNYDQYTGANCKYDFLRKGWVGNQSK